ncbi:hypothetical protein [Niveibacterium sp. SC-1]|uniref:hypothetical protein n=1 Tax=Niveibacterium sp. SC-1 TaxID=3135646 RepID=UPI00311D9838
MGHHDTCLAAPRDVATGRAPVILQREDEDFVDAVMESLRSAEGRSGLAASKAAVRTTQQVLKLFQPIQRQFHLALVEAWCETPGRPRLDPQKVEATGMVLRRERTDAQGRAYLEGWMRASGQLRGWVRVDRMGDELADPQATARLARKATGSVQIDRVLAQLTANTEPMLLNEHVIPMFVAPPDVCAEAGRTLYYGVVPTSSSELASAPPDTAALFEGFGPGNQAFTEHLYQPLRGLAYSFPYAGEYFDGNWFEAIEQPGAKAPEGKVGGSDTILGASLFARITSDRATFGDTAPLHKFVLLLRQVATEFDAFGDSPQSQALFARLETIPLYYKLQSGEIVQRQTTAGSFLLAANRVLLDRDPDAAALEMPETWPQLDSGAAGQLAGALSQAMRARFATVKGRPGRFDEPEARYRLRAFVRLKAEGACPPKTIWSDYSEAFVIAPWYEGAGTPVQIPMPDLTDRDLLKSLKPNVSFVLPPSLQCMLNGSPKDMMEGKFNKKCKAGNDDGNGLSLGWICSFSIPIITLCAFICLNIFLSLFDLFFRWMLFLKICIPFPKIRTPPPPP